MNIHLIFYAPLPCICPLVHRDSVQTSSKHLPDHHNSLLYSSPAERGVALALCLSAREH